MLRHQSIMVTGALLVSCLLGPSLSAEILAVFPHTGKSHFDVYEPLVLGLAKRGHHLTVISFYPQKTPVTNVTDVSLVGLVPLRLNQVQFDQVESPLSDFVSMSWMGLEMCEKILTFPSVRELLISEVKFELLITEFFNTECFLSFSYKFKVPFVAMSSANTYPQHDARLGNYPNLAYISHSDLPFDYRMSLLQKLVNVAYSAALVVVRVYFTRLEQRLVTRLVDPDVPPLETVAHNVSVLLVNTHHSMLRPRPLVPGLVEIGGIHINPLKLLDKRFCKSAKGTFYSLIEMKTAYFDGE